MCGRVIQRLPLNRLVQIARASNQADADRHHQTYNGCPTNFLPAVRTCSLSQDKDESEGQERQLCFMRWGTNTKFSMVINARAEQITFKPMFKKMLKNRCVVIVSGYYQWTPKKEPHGITHLDNDYLLLAALYNQQNQVVLLTKQSAGSLKAVHHRMPVLLKEDQVGLWLDRKNKEVAKIIENCLLDQQKSIWKNLKIQKLAPYVNNMRQKSSKCLTTLAQYKAELDRRGIKSFFKKVQAREQEKVSEERKREEGGKTAQREGERGGKQEADRQRGELE